MKSGDTYRFSLSWPTETEEQILAGEFLSKLGNKKSRFLIQLICDYIEAHPEAINPKETIKFIVSSTSVGEKLTEMIKSMIQSELSGKNIIRQESDASDTAEKKDDISAADIDDMLENLDIWN